MRGGRGGVEGAGVEGEGTRKSSRSDFGVPKYRPLIRIRRHRDHTETLVLFFYFCFFHWEESD